MEQDPPFAAFAPDANALLRRISPHVDDATLECIAQLDPTGSHVDNHLRELRKIRDEGIIADPMQPLEVLESATYQEPDNPRGSFPGHWGRAFAAAALLRAYGDEGTASTCTGVYYPSLIQLLESLRRLDAGLERDGMASLAWLGLQQSTSDKDERLFLGVAILALGARSQEPALEAPLIELAQWLIVEEKRLEEIRLEHNRLFGEPGSAERARNLPGLFLPEQVFGGSPDHWLCVATNPLHPEKWIALGAQLAQSTRVGRSGDAVRAIGRRLSGEILATEAWLS
jgi:hypothetical protein